MITRFSKSQWIEIGEKTGWLKTASRTHYRNGEPIGLSCGCDGCNPSMINNVLCHESGCPFAWKDYKVKCFECGNSFFPEDKGQKICRDCMHVAEANTKPELQKSAKSLWSDSKNPKVDRAWEDFENFLRRQTTNGKPMSEIHVHLRCEIEKENINRLGLKDNEIIAYLKGLMIHHRPKVSPIPRPSVQV